MNKLIKYFKDSRQEFNLVTWPSKKQLIRLSYIVLGITFVMAFLLGFLDYLFQELFLKLL